METRTTGLYDEHCRFFLNRSLIVCPLLQSPDHRDKSHIASQSQPIVQSTKTAKRRDFKRKRFVFKFEMPQYN